MVFNLCSSASAQTGDWNTVSTVNNPTARHECSFGQLGDKFYLMGGRGLKPVQAYDPATNAWQTLGFTPQEIHHFQAAEFYGLMYLICAFQGGFPAETGIPIVYIYDPLTDSWFSGPPIPPSRRRGSAGVVMRDDKFYILSGLTDGHRSGWVKWFDEYDPATNQWTELPDAPRARDHFAAVTIDNFLVAAGGRRSGDGTGWSATFDSVVRKTDVYNFDTGIWSTLASPAGDIPVGVAGCSAAVLDGEVIIIGGESMAQSSAHKQTQALNLVSGTWRQLDLLNTGRHGTQAIVNNSGIYIVAGSGNRGGSPELNSMEVFHFGAPGSPGGVPLVAGSPGAFPPSIAETPPGQDQAFQIDVHHISGNQAVLIHDIQLSNTTGFSLNSAYTYPIALAPGKNLELSLDFSPSDTGLYQSQLLVIYGASLDTLMVPIAANSQSTQLCSTTSQPVGLSVNITGTQVELSWQTIEGAQKCEINGREVGKPNFAKVRRDVPPQTISLPIALFEPSTNYEWRVRCACNLSPLEVTPFSDLNFFTTPAVRTGTEHASADWVLYPNPAVDQVTIQASSASLEDTRAELLDLTGRVLKSWDLQGTTSTLERDDLPPGLYMIRLTDQQQSSIQSLVWE